LSFPRHWRIPAGNDALSVPSLKADDFSAPDLNVISSRYRGLIEFLGGPKGEAFLAPYVKVGGKAVELGKLKGAGAGREDFWTPTFKAELGGEWELRLRLVCPPHERGLFLDLRLKNLSTKKTLKASLGAQGAWGGIGLRINEPYPLGFWRRLEQYKGLNAKHLVLSAGNAAPEFALALGSPDDLDVMEVSEQPLKGAAKWDGKAIQVPAGAPKLLRWLLAKQVEVAPGGEARVGITLGAGLEAVSAAATNVEFKRRSLAALSTQTSRWLAQRRRHTGDARLDDLLNWNLFFNLFYATGVSLDTEQFVSLTSRSPHYYVSGAYWDRDALLWSLPAIQMVDNRRARQVLEYAFGVQGRNIGVHSRFLDGTVLEPGFELDELCAPIIALAAYVKATGDQGLLKDWGVRDTLRRFERVLQSHKHPTLPLYETLSGPDDDHEPQGFLTIGNVLVWKALLGLAELKDKLGRGHEAGPLKEQAERVRQAIWSQLTAEGPRGKQFVWSADLRGHHRFYSSPAGCLQLLPYYGFCPQEDNTLRNTTAWLHSREFSYSFHGEPFEELGCAHSSQPWILSIATSLLSGRREQAKALLEKLELDGGLACEAFDSKTGKPFSGSAFATCAGFLAFAIHRAYGKSPASQPQSNRPPQQNQHQQGQRPPQQPQQARPQEQGQRQNQQARPQGQSQQQQQRPQIQVQAPPKPQLPPAQPSQWYKPGTQLQPQPPKPVGAVLLKGGKRSTKGVEALVRPEPLRPPKGKAPAAKAAPAKAAPGKPKPKTGFKIKPKKKR
jgi:meiotically up-regulated gene 157 (Mug157) protein